MILYREDFERETCAVPGCDCTAHDTEMYIHARCHPDAPTWTIYSDGALRVVCVECERPICEVSVAHAPSVI